MRPGPVQQVPLPPLDTTGNPLIGTPAQLGLPRQAPNKRWWLGNAWNTTIPGLPFVPGGSSNAGQTMALSWFIDRYPAAWQGKILTRQCQCAYSHFTTSWPDSRAYGQSIQQFISTLAWLKSWGMFTHVMLGSKDYDPANPTWADWGVNVLTPALSAMLDAGVVDMVAMWETNLWNVPGQQLQDILGGISDLVKPAGVDQWVHFSTEVTSWQTDGTDRSSWWELQKGVLVGILYQADGAWDMGTCQARFQDTTVGNFPARGDSGFGGPFLFVNWEADGYLQFDTAVPDEPTSAMRNYVRQGAGLMAGSVPISGTGAGLWLSDGSVALP